MKTTLALFFCLASGATAAQAQWGGDIAGTYLGTCLAQYAGTQAAPCQVNLSVDTANGVYAAGCISQTAFSGVLFGTSADLRAPGWNAQPRGQTLDLTFQYDQWSNSWTAQGSGYGIQDRKWTYHCSFRQQY